VNKNRSLYTLVFFGLLFMGIAAEANPTFGKWRGSCYQLSKSGGRVGVVDASLCDGGASNSQGAQLVQTLCVHFVDPRKCIAAASSSYFDAEAVDVCREVAGTTYSLASCFDSIMGRKYKSGVPRHCRTDFSKLSEVMNCLELNGQ
jgi:hypothetical protein